MIDDDVKWQHVARVATAARHRQMRAGTMMYNDYDPSYVDDKSNIDPLDPDAQGQHTPSPPTANPMSPPRFPLQRLCGCIGTPIGPFDLSPQNFRRISCRFCQVHLIIIIIVSILVIFDGHCCRLFCRH